jgi:hypothetical protein
MVVLSYISWLPLQDSKLEWPTYDLLSRWTSPRTSDHLPHLRYVSHHEPSSFNAEVFLAV